MDSSTSRHEESVSEPALVTEDGDDSLAQFSTGSFEMEIFPEGAESCRLWKQCKKNRGHKNFIPASKFTIQHLPEPYRTQEYFDMVELMSSLTVKLNVKCTSCNRPDNDPFSHLRNKKACRTGSGIVLPSIMGYWEKGYDFSNVFSGQNPVEDKGDDTALGGENGETGAGVKVLIGKMKELASDLGYDPDTGINFIRNINDYVQNEDDIVNIVSGIFTEALKPFVSSFADYIGAVSEINQDLVIEEVDKNAEMSTAVKESVNDSAVMTIAVTDNVISCDDMKNKFVDNVDSGVNNFTNMTETVAADVNKATVSKMSTMTENGNGARSLSKVTDTIGGKVDMSAVTDTSDGRIVTMDKLTENSSVVEEKMAENVNACTGKPGDHNLATNKVDGCSGTPCTVAGKADVGSETVINEVGIANNGNLPGHVISKLDVNSLSDVSTLSSVSENVDESNVTLLDELHRMSVGADSSHGMMNDFGNLTDILSRFTDLLQGFDFSSKMSPADATSFESRGNAYDFSDTVGKDDTFSTCIGTVPPYSSSEIAARNDFLNSSSGATASDESLYTSSNIPAKNDSLNTSSEETAMKTSTDKTATNDSLNTSSNKTTTNDSLNTSPNKTATDDSLKTSSGATATANGKIKDLNLFHRIKPCPCPECTKSDSPQPVGYCLLVYTARHVIFDDQEAENTVVDLFYDDEIGAKVEKLYGHKMMLSDGLSDLFGLICVTHKQDLFHKLYKMRDKFSDLIKNVPTNKNPPLALISSHPHGNFKHITVGQWTKRFLHTQLYTPLSPMIHTHYEYDTPTCPGSSGAPVLILGHKENTRVLYSNPHPHMGHCGGGINESGVHASTTMRD